MAAFVDVNADVGEIPFTDPRCQDEALLRVATSANVACGLHAGGPSLMQDTVRAAREYGVAVGAHPGFDDREGFGRREIRLSPREAEALVAYQVGALAAIADTEGVRLRHVKPHGALYNMAARDPALARAIAYAVKAVNPSLLLVGLSGSRLIEAGIDVGLGTVSEAFADRAYRADGSLVPRTEPEAVMHDDARVVARALDMVREQAVTAVDGACVPLRVETLCLHGDTPGAAHLARRLRDALAAAGVEVRVPQGS